VARYLDAIDLPVSLEEASDDLASGSPEPDSRSRPPHSTRSRRTKSTRKTRANHQEEGVSG
jgi:hypothetical protein